MRKIRLAHPHTHAGKTYEPGETIEVDVETYNWLMDAIPGLREKEMELLDKKTALKNERYRKKFEDQR